jgi:hypothetical protein
MLVYSTDTLAQGGIQRFVFGFALKVKIFWDGNGSQYSQDDQYCNNFNQGKTTLVINDVFPFPFVSHKTSFQRGVS